MAIGYPIPNDASRVLGLTLSELMSNPSLQVGLGRMLTPGAGDEVIFPPNP